jgi:hypothetical protein
LISASTSASQARETGLWIEIVDHGADCGPALEDVLEVLGPRAGARSVEASSQTYVPFEPKTPAARELRHQLRQQLRRLAAGRGEVLHAVFRGDLPARADVEDLLRYNVDIEGSLLRGRERARSAFRVGYARVARVAFGRERPHAYQYRTAPESHGLRHWRDVRTLAR